MVCLSFCGERPTYLLGGFGYAARVSDDATSSQEFLPGRYGSHMLSRTLRSAVSFCLGEAVFGGSCRIVGWLGLMAADGSRTPG